MKFDYYYGDSVEQFKFIQIPQALITDKAFEELPAISKLMYGLLRDRCTLSRKNGWVDSKNRVYIIYQIVDLMEDMGLSEKMAIKYLNDLESFGLIEKKRQGFGLPNLLYVKNFCLTDEGELSDGNDEDNDYSRTSLKESSRPSKKGSSVTSLKGSSDLYKRDVNVLPDCAVQDLPKKVALNNTNNILTNSNKTNNSNTLSNPINASDAMRLNTLYVNHAKEQIGYDSLCEDYPEQKSLIDNILDSIVETYTTRNEFLTVAKERKPAALVKARFLGIERKHVEYVMSMLNSTGNKVGNIKQYLLTMLYNAPCTFDAYITAEVAHDLRQAI